MGRLHSVPKSRQIWGMRLSFTSGSLFNGLAIIGGALMFLLPKDTWVGVIVVAIGVASLFFDVKLDRGHFAVGSPKTLGRRLIDNWPPMLMALAAVAFTVGVWGQFFRMPSQPTEGGTSEVVSKEEMRETLLNAAAELAPNKPSPAPLPVKRATDAPEPWPTSAEVVRNVGGVSRAETPSRSIASAPHAAEPVENAFTQLVDTSGAARIVTEFPQYSINPKDAANRTIQMRIKNIGPGIAYAGIPAMAYEVTDLDKPIPDVDKELLEQITAARKAVPPKTLQIEVGASLTVPTIATIPEADWKAVIDGKKRMTFIQSYVYVSDATAPGTVEIASFVGVYGEGNGTQVQLSLLQQFTKTYRKLK